MGGCQNYGPFLGTLNIRYRIIIGTPTRDHNFDNHPYGLGVLRCTSMSGESCIGLTMFGGKMPWHIKNLDFWQCLGV